MNRWYWLAILVQQLHKAVSVWDIAAAYLKVAASCLSCLAKLRSVWDRVTPSWRDQLILRLFANHLKCRGTSDTPETSYNHLCTLCVIKCKGELNSSDATQIRSRYSNEVASPLRSVSLSHHPNNVLKIRCISSQRWAFSSEFSLTPSFSRLRTCIKGFSKLLIACRTTSAIIRW